MPFPSFIASGPARRPPPATHARSAGATSERWDMPAAIEGEGRRSRQSCRRFAIFINT